MEVSIPLGATQNRPFQRARERRLIWLLLVAWIINLFDLGMTLLAWRQNLVVELNPFAAMILPHGTAAVMVYKVGLLVIGTAALWCSRRHWATEPAVWAYLMICVGLSFWWHSIISDLHRSQADLEMPAWVRPTVVTLPPHAKDFPPGIAGKF